MWHKPKRTFQCLPTGRPPTWTTELLLDAAREWRDRYGQLPRPTDWSTQRATKLGGEALARLNSPPDCASRWPAASTVNDVFGKWEWFRAECEQTLTSQGQPAKERAQNARSAPVVKELAMCGDADVIACARERWHNTPDVAHDDDWDFAAWAITTGDAVLPNVTFTSTRGILQARGMLLDLAGQLTQVHVIFPPRTPAPADAVPIPEHVNANAA